MIMVEIGGILKGGVCWVVLSEEDKCGCDLFIEWCIVVGCIVEVDFMGNIFVWRVGIDLNFLVVMIGSYFDS